MCYIVYLFSWLKFQEGKYAQTEFISMVFSKWKLQSVQILSSKQLTNKKAADLCKENSTIHVWA